MIQPHGSQPGAGAQVGRKAGSTAPASAPSADKQKWHCPESCDVFGDYIGLRERITSGKARGKERDYIGWAVRPMIRKDKRGYFLPPIFWRWHDEKRRPVFVRPIAWQPYERRRVSWTPPDSDPARWEITREDAERRVIRHCKTSRVQPNVRAQGFAGIASGMADMISDTLDSAHPPRPVRFEPTRADLSDELIAGAWFAALKTPNRRPRVSWQLCWEQELIAVRACAEGEAWHSFADMARILGRSETVIAGHYAGAINEVWALANSGGS